MPATPASAALEFDFFARPAQGLTISLGGAFNDAEITEDFCLIANPFDCTSTAGDDPTMLAPRTGCRSPRASRAMPGSATNSRSPAMAGPRPGRRASHEGRRTRDLRLVQRAIYGDLAELRAWSISASASRTSAGRRRALRPQPVRRARRARQRHPVQRAGLRRPGRPDRDRARRSTPSSPRRGRSASGSGVRF